MMKKQLVILLIPLLISCSSFKSINAEEEKHFIATELQITDYNYNALNYESTLRGIKIVRSDNMTSTDAYLRFDNINNIHSVNVQSNKYLAIRYRSNYDPEFNLRIKSTSGDKNWSDFRFPDNFAHIDNTIGTWNTYVFSLTYDHSASVTKDEYDSWELGDYVGVSFNITNTELFSLENSYLYISSFAFFNNEEDANNYSGLDYASILDTEGPVITIPYGDGETFTTSAGKKYDFEAEAYDEYDDTYFVVKGEVPSEALDSENKLKEGTYAVLFTVSDSSGNISTKTLNLVVKEKDTVAPVINCDLDTIYIQTGTYNCLVFTAYDEIDGEIKCEYLYSNGAVDSENRFLKGNHVLTITATDLTGNVASKNVSIIVSDDINPDGLEIIEEEK